MIFPILLSGLYSRTWPNPLRSSSVQLLTRTLVKGNQYWKVLQIYWVPGGWVDFYFSVLSTLYLWWVRLVLPCCWSLWVYAYFSLFLCINVFIILPFPPFLERFFSYFYDFIAYPKSSKIIHNLFLYITSL